MDLLDAAYARFVGEVAAGTGKLNLSGHVESQGQFAERFAATMRARLSPACGLVFAVQTVFPNR